MVSALYLMAAAAITSTVFAAPAATSDVLDPIPTEADATWPATSKPTKLSELIRVQEAQLEYISSVCTPNIYKFSGFAITEMTLGELSTLGEALIKSDFPCEKALLIEQQCLPIDFNGHPTSTTPDGWKKEYECVCSSKLHELKAACANCEKVHGLDPEAADKLIKVASKVELSVCSATAAPTTDYGSLSTSILRAKENGCCTYTGSMMRFETGSDLFPSQTAISHYYTSGAAIATGSVTTTGSAKAPGTGVTSGASTQASGTGVSAASTSAPATGANATSKSAPATGGATELKAAGGLVMAFLGVMAAI